MAFEMPERVMPVTGATWVDFPWASATIVLAALDDLISTVTSQLELRPGMVGTLGDWTGWYRDDFDDKHESLMTAASGILETASARAGAVITAAEDANTEQRQENREAESRLSLANARLQ